MAFSVKDKADYTLELLHLADEERVEFTIQRRDLGAIRRASVTLSIDSVRSIRDELSKYLDTAVALANGPHKACFVSAMRACWCGDFHVIDMENVPPCPHGCPGGLASACGLCQDEGIWPSSRKLS